MKTHFALGLLAAHALAFGQTAGQMTDRLTGQTLDIAQAREIDLDAEIAANKQSTDTGAIEAAVDAVLAANADKVAEYKGGKEALFGFFVGQTMKAMQGKANPQVVNELLKTKLA